MPPRATKTTKRTKPVDSHVLQLAKDKLQTSGLTVADAEILGIEFLDAAKTAQAHKAFKALTSLKINYYSPIDGKPLSPWPKWPAFYRIRYLEQPADFNQLTEAKPMRYVNEPGAGVAAYFPRNVDWSTIIADPDEPLIITEGELKAAKACKEGYPTIGLGGVYNFRSSSLGITFLDELEAINWCKRRVYIIYDSDFRTNGQVCSALNALANELMARGAIPYTTPLPDVVEGGKTGLDDFLLTCTDQDELGSLLRDRSVPLTLAQTLWDLNKEVAYVRDPGLIIVKKTNQKLTPGSFKEHAYATYDASEQVMNKDGDISIRPVSAAAAWLKWQLRHEVNILTYKPGAEQLIGDGTPTAMWNVWPGWGCQPKKGDVKPFLQLVDHLFTGADKGAKEWFLRWCAYPLQYPGTKLFTSVLLYGVRHGTGKSLVGYTLGKIYGRNFTEISQLELHGAFNEYAEAKQLIMADDITGSNKRQDNDLLKKLITQKEMRINMKYMPSYVVPDCINYMFTANQPDTLFLEDDDRRHFVHEVLVAPLEEEFYVDYTLWLDTGGAEAVFDYLLKLDIGDFNPAAHAFRTAAKERMIADVKSDLGAWVARLRTDPDSVLRLGEMNIPGDLFTNRHLLNLYDPDGRTGTTANGLGREMRRSGFVYACGGTPVKGPEGLERYYIVRNHNKWLGAESKDVVKHLADLAKKKEAKY